jgi:hypothetical protein
MTKLSTIADEARGHLGRISEQELEDLQRALIHLGESHWSDIRGPEPASGLARVLWTVAPPLADLIVDLYGASDPRFLNLISQFPPTKVLAALVLAEIERDNAEGARLAYDAMMLFETPKARDILIDSVHSRLAGLSPERGRWHKHAHHDVLFRFFAFMAEQTGRCDLEAMAVAVDYLAVVQAGQGAREDDPLTTRIVEFLEQMELVFQNIENGQIHYTLRGEPKKPVTFPHLEEILTQIRGHP